MKPLLYEQYWFICDGEPNKAQHAAVVSFIDICITHG